MNHITGTIYLRDNTWYKRVNVIKMGITSFAKDRSTTYITGEVEIPLDKMNILYKYLKLYFKAYNIKMIVQNFIIDVLWFN